MGSLPKTSLFALLLAAMTMSSPAAPPVNAAGQTGLVDIAIEMRHGDTPQVMNPEHVFATGDVIRFRLTSMVNGYLYVTNLSSSGKYTTLFPAPQTGSDNKIEAKKEYFVPATSDGWFEVEGPAGFETLYFLVSPAPVTGAASAPAFTPPGPLSSLKPRCNDAIFHARGECIDTSAGVAPAPAAKQLPPDLQPAAGAASRDLVFSKKKDSTSVSAAGPLAGPVIYTFRLAHK